MKYEGPDLPTAGPIARELFSTAWFFRPRAAGAAREMADMAMLERFFRVLKADAPLLYSPDYPHWDFGGSGKIRQLGLFSKNGLPTVIFTMSRPR